MGRLSLQSKARSEGLYPKEGIDYEKTLSHVIMIKSIHILLSTIATLDYETWQMDVYTAFLNKNLTERIYMVQPEGFV